MTRIAMVLFLAGGLLAGCGSATAEKESAAAPTAAAEVAAPAPATAPDASAAETGSCPGGPGGSCCGGGGSCSQMAESDDGEGGCACQKRARLIEKARQQAASE